MHPSNVADQTIAAMSERTLGLAGIQYTNPPSFAEANYLVECGDVAILRMKWKHAIRTLSRADREAWFVSLRYEIAIFKRRERMAKLIGRKAIAKFKLLTTTSQTTSQPRRPVSTASWRRLPQDRVDHACRFEFPLKPLDSVPYLQTSARLDVLNWSSSDCCMRLHAGLSDLKPLIDAVAHAIKYATKYATKAEKS